MSGALLSYELSTPQPAAAVIQRTYSLPFYANYNLTCGFGCYSGHAGVDYEVGTPGIGGDRIVAGAAGTVKTCGPSDTAGNYLVLDHGNGHRTRYLHLTGFAVPNGKNVGRGGAIGYEGSTGQTDPPGFNHLHFETRHGATTFTCNKDGTAVDPYAGSTYMWLTNPVSYAQKINDFNGDGITDTVSFNSIGHAWVGLNTGNNTFSIGNWGTTFAWGEIPSTGDFNRDGLTDTVAFNSIGHAWIGLNTGNNSFTLSNWGVTSGPGEMPLTGDFNGDGRMDTVSFNSAGHAWVGLNTGNNSFAISNWGTTFAWGEIPLTGDFNADGRTDTISFNSIGHAWVGLNTGNNSFSLGDWGVTHSWGEIPSTGDFNGDGRTDTVSFNTIGHAWVGLNTGNNSFSIGDWGTTLSWGEMPLVGLYNADNRADTQAFNSIGHAWVGLNTGSSFSLGDWGVVGAWGEIPGGFQPFAYEKRFDRWWGLW